MNVSFAIHGTPGKSECWGIPNDETYLRSFYDDANNASELTRLNIDYRVVDNVVCSYYHYLKLKNISNGIARSGGYFGMTIRFEGTYCLDISNLFKMMNQLYEQVVCNSNSGILKSDGINTTYIYSTFKDCQAQLENIKDLAGKALEQFRNDIKEFPPNYSPRHGDIIRKYNVADTGSESFHQVLLKEAEVYVSPEYPLLSISMMSLEKDNIDKTEQIKEQQATISRQNGEISSLNNRLESQNQTIISQNTKIQNHSSEISQKNQKIKKLEIELDSTNQSISRLVNRIEELEKQLKEAHSNKDMQDLNKCISSLNRILESKRSAVSTLKTINSGHQQLASEINDAKRQLTAIDKELKALNSQQFTDEGNNNTTTKKQGVGNYHFNWKTILASLFGLIACLFMLYYLLGNPTINERSGLNEELASFKKETDERFKQIETKLAILPNFPKTNVNVDTQSIITRINLKGGSSVQCNKTYTFEAYSGNQIKDCGGLFSCSENGTIQDNNGSKCVITVNTKGDDDSLHVSYTGNGTTISRSILIK